MLNRYRDVYPYDHSRVKLEERTVPVGGDGGQDSDSDSEQPQQHRLQTDYINASLVKVRKPSCHMSIVSHEWSNVCFSSAYSSSQIALSGNAHAA